VAPHAKSPAGCHCLTNPSQFEELHDAFRKTSDVVENASIRGKYNEEDFECLKTEYAQAIEFIAKEEETLKNQDYMKELDAKDKTDFLIASKHHGVVGLS